MVARERLRIAFGHYCHETLLSVFSNRPIFLFTGLREPVSCAVSGYHHVNAVRALAGREPVSAEAYLEAHANPMSTEILRCFPSLANPHGALWQRARAALSMFDFIYATERFAADAATLFDILEFPRGPVGSENVSDARQLPAELREFVKAGSEAIRANDREFLGEDMRLWEAMQPYLSRPWVRGVFAEARWAIDRGAFMRGLPSPAEALDTFCARERIFMVHEFSEIGRLPALRASLERRVGAAQDLLARIADYET
jgi:hypothetical protein